MIRLSLALDPAAHYGRGYHPTATCGVFGAAAARLSFDNTPPVPLVGVSIVIKQRWVITLTELSPTALGVRRGGGGG